MVDQALISRIRQRANDAERTIDMTAAIARVASLPIAPDQLAKAEADLGFVLPEFLRQLYLQVGNGGFGPGYGLIALRGEPTIQDRDLVDLYLKIAVIDPLPPPFHPWPKALMIVADWGCGIY